MKKNIGTDIVHAKALLDSGEVVAIPTETVYGLAANAFDAVAVAKIFEAKNRPHFNPLIVHTHSIAQLQAYTNAPLPAAAVRLAQACMPGALTLVLPKSPEIPEIVTAGQPTVALRIPSHPTALALLKTLNYPLAAPSANPYGYLSPTTAQHVALQLNHKIPYILNGGTCAIGIESTIVKIENNEIIVLRLGGLSVEYIQDMAQQTIKINNNNNAAPQAPGMLSSHYAPHKKLILVDDLAIAIKKYDKTHRFAVLSFSDFFDNIPQNLQFVLSPSGNMHHAAAALFTTLHTIDALDIDIILAQKLPNTGLGAAINDRLQRAAF